MTDMSHSWTEVADGIIISAANIGEDVCTIYVAGKVDAEYLYHEVDCIAEERSIESLNELGRGTDYYLDLADSEYDIGEQPDDWNLTGVYQVSFEANDKYKQRLKQWHDENGNVSRPRDFELTEIVANTLYKVGAHEQAGEEAPYIELIATGGEFLEAAFEEEDIDVEHVNNMWRISEESSAIFRRLADIEQPAPLTGAVDTQECDD